jgi:hypothetical protein
MAHWILDTAGIGGIIVALVAIPILIAYIRMVRWIAAAPRDAAHSGAAHSGGAHPEAGAPAGDAPEGEHA